MISRSNLKESFSVTSKNGAIFSGGKVRWSTDGSTLFCPNAGAINVIDLESGRSKVTLGDEKEDADFIYCFAVTHDGNNVISAHKSGLFKSWEVSGGNLLKQWKNIHKGPVNELDVSKEGNLLASGGSDSIIRIWDLVHHSCIRALRDSTGVISVVKICLIKGETVIFGCGDDLKITCWDLESSEMLFQLSGHYSKVTSISLCDDGKHLASCARDNVVMLWNLETQECIKTFPVFEILEDVVALPTAIELPDLGVIQGGIYVATAGERGIIRIFDMAAGREIFTQSNPLVGKAQEKGGLSITQLLYNHHKKSFAVITVDHNIIFHDLCTFECTKQLIGFSDEILDIVFLGADNSHVAVATNSCDIKLYNLKSMGSQLLKGHTDLVLTLASSIVKCNWMLSGAKDNTIRLWELDSESEKVECLAVGLGHTASVSALFMSQMTNDSFFSTSQDTTLKMWTISRKPKDSENKYSVTVKYTEIAHQKDINTVSVSPNDNFVATGSQDKTIKLWVTENLSYVGTFVGHRRGVWCVRFSPTDKIILSSSADATIKIWSVANLTCLKTFEGHDSSVLRAEFVTSGMQIITTSGDGLVKLWNIKSGECAGTFNEHEGKIWAMAVSTNEKILVTGGSDSLLVVWRDSTQEKREAAAKAQEDLISNEQLLSNLINSDKLFAALGLALSLDKPFKVLSIVKDLINKGQKEEFRSTIKKLSDTDKERLLECASVWNSNSRNCVPAQLVLSILLEEIACGELKLTKLPTFVEQALPYTDRHFKRLTNLMKDLHFLQYTVAMMKPEIK